MGGLRVNVTNAGETVESFTFTEEKTKLMKMLAELKESADDDDADVCDSNAADKEDAEVCDVINLPLNALPTGATTVVDLESLKRAFHFTTLTDHSNHKLPMPMPTKFSETEVIIGDDKDHPIALPEDIKKFFQYTVVNMKADAAQERAIRERDEEYSLHAGVAGKFGSLNIPEYGLGDEFLNPAGSVYDLETVNNPRELIRLMKAAQYLNYDVLLKYASAKLATLISFNTAYRIRALLGMAPNGGYTWEEYTNAAGEKVKGLKEVKEEAPWFDMDKENDKVYKAVVKAYLKENITYLTKEEALEEEKAKDNKMIPKDNKMIPEVIPDEGKITDIYDY